MVHSRTRCSASQTGVIIQALAPVIGPYISRAITTIHAQEMSDRAMSDPMRTGDGRRVMTPDCRTLDATIRRQQYSFEQGGSMAGWRIEGNVLIACNCDFGCPCNFNARPSRGFCEGGWIWIIEKGRVDNVALDG